MMDADYRIEKDSLGEVKVPKDALWGAQTQRAVENFDVSSCRIHRSMIKALALIKSSAAAVNYQLGLLPKDIADGITAGAEEIMEGRWDNHFPVDVFQTGSGTSWNMNMNEVISARASRITGKKVHPNDHVNRCQSSNDVIPSAMAVSARLDAVRLISSLEELKGELEKKADEHAGIVKLGRTHLQDAVPMRGGDEISAWAHQIRKSVRRIEDTLPDLEELPLGGTAVGTGINAHPDFGRLAGKEIAEKTGLAFRSTANKFEGIAARDAHLFLMGALNSTAVSLMKIAQDLRLLSSGPRGGYAELKLPALQPGSSIMPGKVNPVVPEMVIQAAAFVMGKNQSVTIACQNGPLQLNIMLPLISHEVLTSINLLSGVAEKFGKSCIAALQYDEERCRKIVEKSLALVTPFALKAGYDTASKAALRAYREGKTLREIILEEGLADKKEIDTILDPEQMI